MRLVDADALIKEIEMDIEDVGLQEKMVFYRINEALQAEPSDGDLISRQDAIEAVKQAIYNHDSAIMRITSLPSASVEVVRCGECKHKYMKDFDVVCPYMVGIIKPNMHCSYGEREGE